MRRVAIASMFLLTLTLRAQQLPEAATITKQVQEATKQRRSIQYVRELTGEFTPTASEEIAKGPVPRMPDGKPDLHGPWVGGGSNSDIEMMGGLKEGEMPLPVHGFARRVFNRLPEPLRNRVIGIVQSRR